MARNKVQRIGFGPVKKALCTAKCSVYSDNWHQNMSRKSSVSQWLDHEINDRDYFRSVSGRRKSFSSSSKRPDRLCVQPAPLNWCHFHEDNVTVHLCSTEVKDAWSCNSTPHYVVFQLRGNFRSLERPAGLGRFMRWYINGLLRAEQKRDSRHVCTTHVTGKCFMNCINIYGGQ